MAKIVVNYGHRDQTGGGAPGEAQETPVLGNAIRNALQAAGHAVWVVQEQDKDGDANFLADNLDGVWKVTRQLDADHGPLDLFLDIHQEGDAANVPGLFAIVPDANGLRWYYDGTYQTGDTRADNPLDLSFCRAVAKWCGKIPNVGIRTSGVIEDGVMSETQTGVAEGGWRLAVFGGTYSLRDHMARCVIECGDVMDAGVHAPGFENVVAKGVLAAVNEVFPLPANQPKPAPEPAWFNADGTPTEHGLSKLFSAKRSYATKGPVSTCWRNWCRAHGMYPAESADPIAADQGVIYTFGPLRILYAHGKATALPAA